MSKYIVIIMMFVVIAMFYKGVEVLGPSKIIYGGNDKPILSCGARVVIKTDSEINIVK